MQDKSSLFINGQWVPSSRGKSFEVINPTTEEAIASISLGNEGDVDRAVSAARAAFPSFSATPKEVRINLLDTIASAYEERLDDLAQVIATEMGSPIKFARNVQAGAPLMHFREAARVLAEYRPEHSLGKSRVVREPIGVCGLITPWNWPVYQIVVKAAYAIAAGCTMVVKPSEFTPLSAMLLTEILDAASVPAGVFNLVNGDGPTVGKAISSHPDIDMVSFTGSTRAGVLVAQDAATTVKRVQQELGGKSANIILPSAKLGNAVERGVRRAFMNSGQSCQAPTRMLVHKDQIAEAESIAKSVAESIVVGDPWDDASELGPLANRAQFERVQSFIENGPKEGARLIAGGGGRPNGLNRGFFVRPTVFGVSPEMSIARQEIFGPVLSMMPYASEDQAVEIANDSDYGLAGYVWGQDLDQVRRVSRKLRAGRIYVNGGPRNEAEDYAAPFGGYKRSGNGREGGVFGFEEYHEVKAIFGYDEET
jgi:aldehyde dehydrogenase (NAD+)